MNNRFKKLREINLNQTHNISDFGVGDHHYEARILKTHPTEPLYNTLAIIWSNGHMYKINVWLLNNSYHNYKRGDLFYVIIQNNISTADAMDLSKFDNDCHYYAYICDEHGNIFDDNSHTYAYSEVSTNSSMDDDGDSNPDTDPTECRDALEALLPRFA